MCVFSLSINCNIGRSPPIYIDDVRDPPDSQLSVRIQLLIDMVKGDGGWKQDEVRDTVRG